MAKRDTVIGFLLLMFGLFWGCKALTYDYQSPYGPGPGFLPFWLSLLLVVLSLLLIIPAWRSYRAGDSKVAQENRIFFNPVMLLKSLGVLLMTAVLLETAGFVLTIGMSTALYVKLVKPEHLWKKSFMIGAVVSVLIYLSFKYLLGLNVPRGVLPL